MKIAKYELKVVHKKKLILTMEDDVDSEELLKIFLKTQLKEEKEQSELLGIIAEKVSEESCTEQIVVIFSLFWRYIFYLILLWKHCRNCFCGKSPNTVIVQMQNDCLHLWMHF